MTGHDILQWLANYASDLARLLLAAPWPVLAAFAAAPVIAGVLIRSMSGALASLAWTGSAVAALGLDAPMLALPAYVMAWSSVSRALYSRRQWRFVENLEDRIDDAVDDIEAMLETRAMQAKLAQTFGLHTAPPTNATQGEDLAASNARLTSRAY